MGSINKWIESCLSECTDNQMRYLSRRGVDDETSVRFYSWRKPQTQSPCPRFTSNFGTQGQKIADCLIIPVYSPRGYIVGMEARRTLSDGSKRVFQYRTKASSYNPYVIGAEKAFQSLWDGCDLWVVEGIFDKVALDKVTPSCDSVISTLRAGMDKNTMEMISRFKGKSSTVYIAYDNDETGRQKAQWLRRNFLNLNTRCEIWSYRGKDPNEIWKTGGTKLLQRMFI